MRPNCKKIESLIHKYVNLSRRNRGLSGLKSNFGLKRLSRSHSSRMARKRYIWHGNGVHLAKDRISATSFWNFISSLFYKGYSGENVAMMPLGKVKGFSRPIRSNGDIALAFHKCWMKSSGHRANILNEKFNFIGIGVKRKGNYYYATQVFYG